jgi:hypothetical protein
MANFLFGDFFYKTTNTPDKFASRPSKEGRHTRTVMTKVLAARRDLLLSHHQQQQDKTKNETRPTIIVSSSLSKNHNQQQHFETSQSTNASHTFT